MILKTLKRSFSEALVGFYPETEIDSFFNLLSEDVLNMKRADIALNLYAVVSGKKYDKFQIALKRLQSNEPIQYILGDTEFYGLTFKVNEHVLIPRPETEELVDLILKETNKEESLNILDVGTGSGCIAISLAKHLPNAKVKALDVSEDALHMARENAKQNDVIVEFVEGNILEHTYTESSISNSEFNVIVSNPPYVRHLEKEHMKANVLDHEPHLALFVEDENPLQFYDAIAQFAIRNLKQNGKIFFEINEYLGKEMIALLESYNFKNCELIKDLSGKDRILKATK